MLQSVFKEQNFKILRVYIVRMGESGGEEAMKRRDRIILLQIYGQAIWCLIVLSFYCAADINFFYASWELFVNISCKLIRELEKEIPISF